MARISRSANAPKMNPDGWISQRTPEGVELHFRVGQNAAGQVIVTDLFVSAEEVNSDVLRSVQPSRILTRAMDHTAHVEDDNGLTFTGDAMARLISFKRGTDDRVTLGELRSRAKTTPKPPRRKPLGRPDGTDPERFYWAVADAYRSAAMETSRAVAVLAEENEVPVETVRRWVKEARRRGHLPPGRKGRAQ